MPLANIASANTELDYELENYIEPTATIIFENATEKKYTVSSNDFIYHEKLLPDNQLSVTIYEKDGITIVDSYTQKIENDAVGITPYCGPPCGYFAVLTFRYVLSNVVSYQLRKSATSAILKTVSKAPASRVQGVIANYQQHHFAAGDGTKYFINKNRMQHFLERHHVNYFNPDLKTTSKQDFFIDTMDSRVLNDIATKAVQKNNSIIKSSADSFVQVEYKYNGIDYKVGVDKSFSPHLVTQLYPKATYIK